MSYDIIVTLFSSSLYFLFMFLYSYSLLYVNIYPFMYIFLYSTIPGASLSSSKMNRPVVTSGKEETTSSKLEIKNDLVTDETTTTRRWVYTKDGAREIKLGEDGGTPIRDQEGRVISNWGEYNSLLRQREREVSSLYLFFMFELINDNIYIDTSIFLF